jgi:hypothetical protein
MIKTTFNKIKSTRGTKALKSQKELDDLVTLAWIDLLVQEVNTFTADDWLPLCDDIDEGEIYRDWFLWQEKEVTQEWEAYDPLTNQRLVSRNLAKLKGWIDNIVDGRMSHPEFLDRWEIF